MAIPFRSLKELEFICKQPIPTEISIVVREPKEMINESNDVQFNTNQECGNIRVF